MTINSSFGLTRIHIQVNLGVYFLIGFVLCEFIRVNSGAKNFNLA